MLNYLYKNWACMCAPIAVFVTLIIAVNAPVTGWLVFAVWLQFIVYLIHQFEEHAHPGGFKNYINKNIFKSKLPDRPLSDAAVFWINIPVIWAMFPIIAAYAQLHNIHYGVLLPIFGMFNASLHILFALIKSEYNPGLGVSVFLNYPSGIATLFLFHNAGLLTASSVTGAFLVSLIVHLVLGIYARMKLKA